MKISFHWLKQYCPVNLSADEVAELLTFCGLETESVTPFESVQGMLKGLVVGEVLEKQKHPNADKLSICKVNTGQTVHQIVCGAANVAAGQKVVVALPGTKLYPVNGDPFEIKKSKIRGEVSEGMICAEDEIGLGKSHEGIMVLNAEAVAGMPAADYFSDILFNDFVFEIGLTPNRGDAASHVGVARDLAAVINHRHPKVSHPAVALSLPDYSAGKQGSFDCPVKVTVQNTSACLRYSGLLVDGITVQESPSWLRNRLLSIGLKPINNVVDITNFVLHEFGQPLHAFDAGKISGNHIIVKNLPRDTAFTTLDGVERKLNGEELMICDEAGGLCIAGVFGGMNSGISENTTRVFLESAYFHPAAIRNASKAHSLKTDASFRFERGADFEMTLPALFRAAQLIQEICGGKISRHTDFISSPFKNHTVDFNMEKACRLMGFTIEEPVIESILLSLGFTIQKKTSGSGWLLSVPSYKTEVTCLADVTEEILRIYGYGNIPLPSQMKMPLPESSYDKAETLRVKMESFLVANGFIEILNNSLIPVNNFGNPVRLLNPLSAEHAILRTEMITSGLQSVAYNLNRKNPLLRLFETGRTYHSHETGFSEQNCLAVFLTRERNFESWHEMKPAENNFFTLKSILVQLLGAAGINAEGLIFTSVQHPAFGLAVQLEAGKRNIGVMGYVGSELLRKFEIETEVLSAVIDLDQCLMLANNKRIISEPSQYPVVKRDLALVLDQSVKYSELEQIAYSSLPRLLQKISVFDIYKGDKIPEGKMSIAIRFQLQDHEKTLTDKQIDHAMNTLMDAFVQKANAEVRK